MSIDLVPNDSNTVFTADDMSIKKILALNAYSIISVIIASLSYCRFTVVPFVEIFLIQIPICERDRWSNI